MELIFSLIVLIFLANPLNFLLKLNYSSTTMQQIDLLKVVDFEKLIIVLN